MATISAQLQLVARRRVRLMFTFRSRSVVAWRMFGTLSENSPAQDRTDRQRERGRHQGRVANVVEIGRRRSPSGYTVCVSGGAVKGHGGEGLGEGFPSVDLAHGDLTGCEQRPEQHRHGLCAGQDGLLDHVAPQVRLWARVLPQSRLGFWPTIWQATTQAWCWARSSPSRWWPMSASLPSPGLLQTG